MSKRARFIIRYPYDHEDEKLRGTKYRVHGKEMLVMNTDGIIFIFNGSEYYPSISLLSKRLPRYIVQTVLGDPKAST